MPLAVSPDLVPLLGLCLVVLVLAVVLIFVLRELRKIELRQLGTIAGLRALARRRPR